MYGPACDVTEPLGEGQTSCHLVRADQNSPVAAQVCSCVCAETGQRPRRLLGTPTLPWSPAEAELPR